MQYVPLIITLAVVSLIFITRWRQTGPWRAFLKANGDNKPLLDKKEVIVPGRVELQLEDLKAIIRSYLERATSLCPSTNLSSVIEPLIVQRSQNGTFLWGAREDLNNRIKTTYSGDNTILRFTSIPNYRVLAMMIIVGVIGGWTAIVPVIFAVLIRKYDIDCTSAFVAYEVSNVLGGSLVQRCDNRVPDLGR